MVFGYEKEVERERDALRAENEQLKEAIRRLAEQDATLSVQGGNVIVEMDATLTDKEREAVARARAAYADHYDDPEMVEIAVTLGGLLERQSYLKNTEKRGDSHMIGGANE